MEIVITSVLEEHLSRIKRAFWEHGFIQAGELADRHGALQLTFTKETKGLACLVLLNEAVGTGEDDYRGSIDVVVENSDRFVRRRVVASRSRDAFECEVTGATIDDAIALVESLKDEPLPESFALRLHEADTSPSRSVHPTELHDELRDIVDGLVSLKVRRLVRSAAVVEDIRQEVFARCFARLDELRDARKLGAFVNSICSLVLMEYMRAETRTQSLENEPDAPDFTTESELGNARDAARVQRLLETLPKRDADILRAVFLEEAGKEDICRRFGIDRDYLRVLVRRMRERFKAHFLSGPTAAKGAGRSGKLLQHIRNHDRH